MSLSHTTKRRNSPLAGFVLLAVAATMGWMIISNHAMKAHSGERWSAERIYYAISESANDPDRGVCRPLIVHYCPNAIGRTGSINFGEISPQVRTYCGLSTNHGAMGVFGITPRIYITGHIIERVKFERLGIWDECIEQDVTWLQNFLAGW